MRSTVSSSEIKTIIKDNFRKYWTVPAFSLFWFLVWGFIPMLLIDSDFKLMRDMLLHNENFGYVTGILILAIGSGMTVFSYLRDPGASNYIFSLPMSREKVFGANMLSGLLMIAGPLVVNCILMCLVLGTGMFVKWFVITAIGCFAIYAITVFAAVMSGNTLMHLFNSLFICGMVSLVAVVFHLTCSSLLFGYASPAGFDSFMRCSNPLTPFMGDNAHMVMSCILYLAVGLAALAAGFVLYKRRAVERTGESLVFSWARPALLLICIFCGACLAGLFFSEIMSETGSKLGGPLIIGMVIGALIVFVVGSLMIDRTARIFTRRNLIPAAISLILAFGAVYGTGTDVTGYTSRVPDPADVDTVYVDLTSIPLFGYITDQEEGGGYTFRFNADSYKKADDAKTMVMSEDMKVFGMSSKEAVTAVTDLQKALINQDKRPGHEGESVFIIYKLKNGKEMRRSYEMYSLSDGFAETRDDIDPAIVKAADRYYDSAEFKKTYSYRNIRPELIEHGEMTYYRDDDGTIQEEISIKPEDNPGLIDAMERDFQENSGSVSHYCDATLDLYMEERYMGKYDYYEGGMTLPVSKDTKHTLQWLHEHYGITLKN